MGAGIGVFSGWTGASPISTLGGKGTVVQLNRSDKVGSDLYCSQSTGAGSHLFN